MDILIWVLAFLIPVLTLPAIAKSRREGAVSRPVAALLAAGSFTYLLAQIFHTGIVPAHIRQSAVGNLVGLLPVVFLLGYLVWSFRTRRQAAQRNIDS